MHGINRRYAIKAMASAIFLPHFLKADGALDIETPSANYVLMREKNGSLTVESAKDEVRFRVGKNGFMLRKNSKINILTEGAAIKTMKLISGGVMGVFAEGTKRIESRTFTAGIRGTGIYLEEQSSDAVYCCLCYGEADYVTNENGSNLMSLVSRHHDRPVSIVKTASGKIELFDDKTHNHNDDELRVLEKMCGRVPPFEEWLLLQKAAVFSEIF